MNNRGELSRFLHGSDDDRIRPLVEFWSVLRVCEETGRTSWETLESLERQVTECLVRGTASDLLHAESLTARAQLLIAGLIES